MASQLSVFLVHTLKTAVKNYSGLRERTSTSPGIPVQNSSLPYWTVPQSSIAQYGAHEKLSIEADIVIIGSGISGTAIAKTILEDPYNKPSINVVMLEARDLCSGATGRNGGHICPVIYNEYSLLKASHGTPAALEILRFRLAHIKTLLNVAEKENLLEASQARMVDGYDAYMHPDLLQKAKSDLKTFLREAPEELHEGFKVLEDENIKEFQLSSAVRGCIVKPGAAIHAYRFVTGILSNLLSQYPNFHIHTRTPCTDIHTSDGRYVVTTPKGTIKTSHVIHATNAWSSHLLPGLRKKIVPFRAHMSAQLPGQNITTNSSRAFVFYPTAHPYTYDYLTQLLPRDSSQPRSDPDALPTDGEMMYGGGQNLGGVSDDVFLENIGVADDGDQQFQIDTYLAGSLERYFGDCGGGAGVKTVPEGRVKSTWSGIIGLSADMLPWVGRIPKVASGRDQPAIERFSPSPAARLAAPGEWISAGFTGEGMVHAWLCGRALARMVLGHTNRLLISPVRSSASTTQTVADEDLPLPGAFLITKKRVRKAKLERLIKIYQ